MEVCAWHCEMAKRESEAVVWFTGGVRLLLR